MYACVVKNSQGTWDVFSGLSYSLNPVKQEILTTGVESGLPITGMVMTPYKWSATPGAIFDGIEFTGGTVSVVPQTGDWEGINTYGYLCDNIHIGGFIATVNSAQDAQLQAIFSEETTIIKVPEGLTVKVGDIWDGENFISN
jgi:hypothetical protein